MRGDCRNEDWHIDKAGRKAVTNLKLMSCGRGSFLFPACVEMLTLCDSITSDFLDLEAVLSSSATVCTVIPLIAGALSYSAGTLQRRSAVILGRHTACKLSKHDGALGSKLARVLFN